MKIYYVLLGTTLVLTSGCPGGRDDGSPFYCRKNVEARVGENTTPEKTTRMSRLFCKGNVTEAAQVPTDPPGNIEGNDCIRRSTLPSRRFRYPELPLSETPSSMMNPRVANLNCVSRDGKEELISQMGVSMTSGVKTSEKQIIANAVTSIVDIAGEERAKHMLSDLSINFVDNLRLRNNPPGRCLPGHYKLDNSPHLNIARRCHPDAVDKDGFPVSSDDFDRAQLTTLLYHEMGHHIGSRSASVSGRGRGSFRSMYHRMVTTKCEISHYCKDSRSEEFSEAFAAFMYSTDRLKQKCPQAYNFFKNVVFDMPMDQERSCAIGAVEYDFGDFVIGP